jgi:hypothetical protein
LRPSAAPQEQEYGLRHVFLEEAAEFAPQKILDGLVYAEIEKLARMGGNARLGYTLINQRAQEVNKAVLELCDNLFLHRQKGKNALDSLKKWLEIAGASGSEAIGTLPTLPQGECWAWLSSSDMPFLWKVPQKNSQHPDRRIMHGHVGAVTKKAVKVDKLVLALQKTLPQLEEQMKSNDPKALQQQISKLTRDLAAAQRSSAPAWPDQREELAQTRKRAGMEQRRAKNLESRLKAIAEIVGRPLPVEAVVLEDALPPERDVAVTVKAIPAKKAPEIIGKIEWSEKGATIPSGEDVTGPQRRILDAIAWWEAFGIKRPTNEQVAFMAGYSPTSGGYKNPKSAARSAGLIEYPSAGLLALTDAGRPFASVPEAPAHVDELHRRVNERLTGPQRAILAPLLKCWPDEMSNDDLAAAAGYSPMSGGYKNPKSSLRTLAVVDYPSAGQIRASNWLFPAPKR